MRATSPPTSPGVNVRKNSPMKRMPVACFQLSAKCWMCRSVFHRTTASASTPPYTAKPAASQRQSACRNAAAICARFSGLCKIQPSKPP